MFMDDAVSVVSDTPRSVVSVGLSPVPRPPCEAPSSGFSGRNPSEPSPAPGNPQPSTHCGLNPIAGDTGEESQEGYLPHPDHATIGGERVPSYASSASGNLDSRTESSDSTQASTPVDGEDADDGRASYEGANMPAAQHNPLRQLSDYLSAPEHPVDTAPLGRTRSQTR
ncbi:unnamed protein product, partial [Discosporangium mesarthrocarpum]